MAGSDSDLVQTRGHVAHRIEIRDSRAHPVVNQQLSVVLGSRAQAGRQLRSMPQAEGRIEHVEAQGFSARQFHLDAFPWHAADAARRAVGDA